MNLVTVLECQSDFDAKLVANYLEDHGVRTYISGGPPSMAGQAAAIPYGAAIQVAEADAIKVKRLLHKRTQSKEQVVAPRFWPDKVRQIFLWSLLGIPVTIGLITLVQWLLGLL